MCFVCLDWTLGRVLFQSFLTVITIWYVQLKCVLRVDTMILFSAFLWLYYQLIYDAWWRHQMETFSAILATARGINRSPVNFPHKGQWHGAFDVFCDLRLNKRLSKQSWGWWFETPSSPLWRHSNGYLVMNLKKIHVKRACTRLWQCTTQRNCHVTATNG